jgi:RNA recognition motif-containing protein
MSDSPEKKKDQIYIGKLSRRIRESDLKEEFKKFGTIVDCQLKNGYAFIVSRFRKL